MSYIRCLRLQKENIANTLEKELEIIPANEFVKIYKDLNKKWMLAPCRYVNFVKTFYHILTKKKSMLVQRQTMLTVCINKYSILVYQNLFYKNGKIVRHFINFKTFI